MFSRWGHGHSTVTGVAVGFGLAGYRPWLIFAGGLLCGVAAVNVWRGVRYAAALWAGRHRRRRPAAAWVADVLEGVRYRRTRSSQSSDIPF